MSNKNLIVVKSNDFVEASYKLTLDEMRVLLLTIGKVDPTLQNHHRDFEFTVAEFSERFNTDEKSAYKQVQTAVDKLGGRWALVESTPKYDRKVTFLTQQIYFKEEGRFKIVLHEDLMPFVSEIKGKFTQYSLEYIAKFSGFHAIRLYEILAQYRTVGWREVTVSELKDWLQVADKYERWDNFKRWVLETSLKEINEKSDLSITYEPIKKGRSIHALRFIISHAKQSKSAEKTEKSRKIYGVFSEIPRPQVAKGSLEEGNWANKNLMQAKAMMKELGIKVPPVVADYSKIPTEWLKVLKKYCAIVDRYSAREIAEELHRRASKLEK